MLPYRIGNTVIEFKTVRVELQLNNLSEIVINDQLFENIILISGIMSVELET